MSITCRQIAHMLRESKGFAAKSDITAVVDSLGISGGDVIPVGDDCAAIPDHDGYILFAIEGFMNEFVAVDPWFAGWCAVMVNVSDVAAMGGRPIAVVDAIWSNGSDGASAVMNGLRAASHAFNVPIVGGHTNLRTDRGQLSTAILGRAKKLLTSFDAEPGDRLIAAIDLRGRFREPFSNWDAATEAPPERLRGDVEILPNIAEAGLSRAAKDISQGGVIGTAAMLSECSRVSVSIELDSIPRPEGTPMERWLQAFPSFGYLIAARPGNAEEILARFRARGIAAATIGSILPGTTVSISENGRSDIVWDFSQRPLIGGRGPLHEPCRSASS